MRDSQPPDQQAARRRQNFGRGDALRPPWTDEPAIRQSCTSCGDCIAACPEAILVRGPAGTPMVNFETAACTFCGRCAAACTEDVFRDTAGSPWSIVATIGTLCLLGEGVSCRTCTDACDEGALRFDVRAGSVGAVWVMTDTCTGCGACVGTCPVGAITLQPDKRPRLEAAQ